MTFESQDIIVEMLKNDGIYPGDPEPSSIWAHKHAVTGKQLFAVFMREIDNDIHESPFVSDPVLLWHNRVGLTDIGRKMITCLKNKN